MTAALRKPVAAEPQMVGPYRLRERLDARGGIERWTAQDNKGQPVVVFMESANGSANPTLLDWEEQIRQSDDLGLAGFVERLEADGRACLVLEVPIQPTLWDVWDDPDSGPRSRYATLLGLAELLRRLHAAGGVLEGLRPEQVHVSADGQVTLAPTVILLPVPTPRKPSVRPSLISPPELHDGQPADSRSDLYCFGTVLYALELGHELSELDFRGPGDPVPFLERFPEAHPLLGRLMAKTFSRLREQRFPSAMSEDLSGFDELIAALAEARRVLGRVRLDIAGWTSTGMIRPGNEDALCVVHAAELRDGVQEEYALVFAADGLGGNDAGEVAAALTVQAMRRRLLSEPPLSGLTDNPALGRPPSRRLSIRRRIADALKEANRLVFRMAREGVGRRGMGCTAEAVYLDGRRLVVGHVGDSRTYLLHRGRLAQMTRDHTLVGRMVELGKLTAEQAAAHPRRNELRQAIGCRGDLRPELATAALSAGDWVVVCTDGLTGCVSPTEIQAMLEQSSSAEAAARRLVNRANQVGAADNVSVVVIRAT
jgi:serine/threonine protein phosphatase PrpC